MPNNREWAIFIWLAIAIVALLFQRDLRSSAGQLVRLVVEPKMLVLTGFMLSWVGLEVWAAGRWSLWTRALATDTVIWFFTTGLLLFGNYQDAAAGRSFFSRKAIQTVSATALIQGYVTLVILNLPLEFFLQPVFFLLGAISVLVATKKDYEAARKPVSAILVVLGLALLSYVSVTLISSWARIDKTNLLRQMALPIWLTVGFLPFIYGFAVFAAYESAFLRIDWADASSPRERLRSKAVLLLTIGLDARAVHRFAGRWPGRLVSEASFSGRRRVVREFRALAKTGEDRE